MTKWGALRRLRAAVIGPGLRPPWPDALLAVAFAAMATAESIVADTARSPLMHLALSAPAMLALAWRRRFPLVVAAIMVASNIVTNPAGQFSTLLALVIVCFTIGSEAAPPRHWAGIALVVLPFTAASVAEGLEPSDLAAAAVFFVGPWVVGVGWRQRLARTTEAIERATRAEAEQAARAEAAAAAERARIARELHDIVSHSLSVVTIQTQAVRRRLGPSQTGEAADLAAVETTARQALAEMRRLFGILRSDGESPSLAPQPGLSELERLLGQVRTAGLPVELEVRGEAEALPPGIDLAAYRIVQEGLTNTLRHAGATRATVVLRYDPTRLEVTVTDDGSASSDGPSGHGLVGIRERVTLYGGSLRAGPGADGGWELVAALPLREAG